MTSVSYTHLDVYKRQEYGYVVCKQLQCHSDAEGSESVIHGRHLDQVVIDAFVI